MEQPDADAISHVIILTLQETNSKDYPPSAIEVLINNFTPERVLDRIKQR